MDGNTWNETDIAKYKAGSVEGRRLVVQLSCCRTFLFVREEGGFRRRYY